MISYVDRMKWYSKHGKFLYPFDIKSFWDFVKNTDFDKSFNDNEAAKSLHKEFIERKKSGGREVGFKTALSKFNSDYCWKLISFYSCAKDKILDPFAGRTRQLICNYLRREYHGFEINKKYANKGSIIDDCINIDSYFSKSSFDLLFTCPPYWDMEKYSKNIKGDLSRCKNYSEFLRMYSNRLSLLLNYIKDTGLAIIIVADFRRNDNFIPLHYDTIKIVEKCGWNLYDLIILEMNPFARRCYYPQAITKRRMLTAHEYCLIFHKNTDIAERKYKEDLKLTKNISIPKKGLFNKGDL